MRIKILLVAVLIIMAGCGNSPYAPPRPYDPYNPHSRKVEDAAHGLLWRVSDGDTVIYLLGTLNMVNETVLPFSKNLMDIIQSSDAVILESSFDDMAQINYLMASKMLPEGFKSSDYIPEDLFKRLVDIYADILVSRVSREDIPAILDRFSMWAMASELMMETYIGNEEVMAYPQVMDFEIFETAMEAGVPVQEMMGLAKMADLYSYTTAALQIEYLQHAMELYTGESPNMETETEMLLSRLGAWRKRDVKAFNAAVDLELVDPMTNYLLEYLTPAMYDFAVDIMENRTGQYFIAVDALHMVTENGLIERFERDGYDVRLVRKK